MRLALAAAAALACAAAALPVEPRALGAEAPVVVERDVAFAGEEGPRLDVHRRAGLEDRPAVLVIHGGGWVAGNRERTEDIADALARAGFVAFNADYTLARKGRPGFRRQPAEMRAAVRFIRAEAGRFGVDPDRVGAFGSSAGGHLAGLIATAGRGPLNEGARVAAAVTWSAPLDLRRVRRPAQLRGLIARFLGCRPCPRRGAALSPARRITRDDPPMMIVNSRREFIPARQAHMAARRLRAAGVPRRLLILPGRTHSPLYAERALGRSIEFLRNRL